MISRNFSKQVMSACVWWCIKIQTAIATTATAATLIRKKEKKKVVVALIRNVIIK